MTAVVEDLTPGSPAWYRWITASKVAAILGVSQYDSPYSLYQKMHGDVEPEPVTTVQARGHYLEPAILSWFFDQHPELDRCIDEQTTYRHPNGWAAATPDAMAQIGDGDGTWVVVEAKTSADDWAWGAEGTDEIPTAYAAQCMWAMYVTGSEKAYVPMLTQRLQFREYVVRFNENLAADIEHRCRAFLDSLEADDPPELDAHPQTYQSLRRAHPNINTATVVDLGDQLGERWVRAVITDKAAGAELVACKSAVADAMGDGKAATWRGSTVATRKAKAGGPPYVAPARTLPTLEASTE